MGIQILIVVIVFTETVQKFIALSEFSLTSHISTKINCN